MNGIPHRIWLLFFGLLALGISSCDPTPPPPSGETKQELIKLTEEEKELNRILKNPEIFEPQPEEPVEPEEFVLNTSNKVSILGYHKFADSQSEDDMVISSKKFRNQMKYLKEAGIPVISMSEFLQWRKGKINIPDYSVIITIDDGWLSVYTHAMPILKEFGYPFSIYLYKDYINLGNQTKSLSYEQIAEIQKNGGEIGSHSVSHDKLNIVPDSMTAEQYQKWLDSELGDSKQFIKENIGVDPAVFTYPYGSYNQQVLDTLHKQGYIAGLTVNGAKVGFKTPMGELGRFIIHGNNDANFKLATRFGRPQIASGSNLLAPPIPEEGTDPYTASPKDEDKLVSVIPEEGSIVNDRTPKISIDLSRLGEFEKESLKMKVAGFGEVPYEFDPEKKLVSYQIPQPLRSPDCLVSVSLMRPGNEKKDSIIWQFRINRNALYLPDDTKAGDKSSPPTL